MLGDAVGVGSVRDTIQRAAAAAFRLRQWRGLSSADPGDVEDSDDLRRVVGVEAQQPVPGVEDGHAEGWVISGRHYGRVPGFIDQVNNAVQQRVECRCR